MKIQKVIMNRQAYFKAFRILEQVYYLGKHADSVYTEEETCPWNRELQQCDLIESSFLEGRPCFGVKAYDFRFAKYGD